MSSQFDLMDSIGWRFCAGRKAPYSVAGHRGAVRLSPSSPPATTPVSSRGRFGDFHRVDLRAGYDFALIEDKLFARITGVSKKQDGYVDQIDFVCEYPQLSGSLPRLITNRDAGCKLGTLGGTDVSGARAQLRYVASDTLSFDLALDYQRDDSGAAADTLLQAGPLVGGFLTGAMEWWPSTACRSTAVSCPAIHTCHMRRSRIRTRAVISAAECPEPERCFQQRQLEDQ